MKRVSLQIAVALLTFVVGVSASTALVLRSGPGPANHAAAPPPPHGQGQHTLEMVFVLDTTGSMSGLLEGAKQRIWGIVNEVMQQSARPSVRIGLVAYRDRGDAYVTRVLPLTSDLDQVYSTLMDLRAEGGGDGPENVRRALADGLERAGWSQSGSGRVAQIIFLVGDAPPHDDYQDEPSVEATTAEAVRRGMIVNTVQCGTSAETRAVWQQIARGGEGQYFAIAQDGVVQTFATRYDARLSELGARLGGTYMAYGGGAGTAGRQYREEARRAQDSIEAKVATAARPAAAAERAVNKALNSAAYSGDLLQDLESDRVKLESVKDEDLPDDLQALAPEARKKEVERRLEERRRLRAEIVALARQRDEFIAAERKKAGASGEGFDTVVAAALRAQMARKGVR